MMIQSRLNRVYQNSKIIPSGSRSKFVLMSDCHRGCGNWGDNFLSNQHLFFGALTYYYQNGFTYIELGDGDELWENRNIKQIISAHSNSFWLMSEFYKEGRLYMIFGNHDMVKKRKKFSDCYCRSYYCESSGEYCELFPDLRVHEGLILQNTENGGEIFLTHGHQGDFINDGGWMLGRFLVRYLWRPLELLGVNDPTRAAKNESRKTLTEKRLMSWAKKEEKILITGHTHRAHFPNEDDENIFYYNDGSCVHPRCITALEIEEGNISLVKWSILTREDRSMYVGRELLEGPRKIFTRP